MDSASFSVSADSLRKEKEQEENSVMRVGMRVGRGSLASLSLSLFPSFSGDVGVKGSLASLSLSLSLYLSQDQKL